jgi:hypothetical protein
MDGLASLLFPQAPSYAQGLLGADEARNLQQQAQRSGLLNIGLGLLAAGAPSAVRTGTSAGLVQGLMAGQEAYQRTYQQRLQEMEMMRKLQEQQRAQQMRQLAGSIIQPSVTPGTPAQFAEESDGNVMVGQMPTAARTSMQIDPQRLAALAALSDNPLAALKTVSEIVPGLRQAGLTTGGPMQMDNPFDIYVTDQTLPQNLRNVAQQYSRSFANGTLPPDKVDERIRQIGESAQRAATNTESMKLRELQMQQSLDLAKSQQEMTRILGEGQQTLAQQGLALRQEQFAEQQRVRQEKQSEELAKRDDAKSQLDTTLRQMKRNYDTLLQEGAIVSTEASTVENIGARASTSGAGRAVGAAVGSKAEQQRQTIEQTRPLLLNLIKNATGMSAQQMNSNAEMQLYLNAATNPALGYEANLEAMANIDRLFGTGEIAKDIEKQLQSTKARTGRSKW